METMRSPVKKCKQRSSSSARVWWPRSVKIQFKAFIKKKKRYLFFEISLLKNDISVSGKKHFVDLITTSM